MKTRISIEHYRELRKKYNVDHLIEKPKYLIFYDVEWVSSPGCIGTISIRKTLELLKESDCTVHIHFNRDNEPGFLSIDSFSYGDCYRVLDTLVCSEENIRDIVSKDNFQWEDLLATDQFNSNWLDNNPV